MPPQQDAVVEEYWDTGIQPAYLMPHAPSGCEPVELARCCCFYLIWKSGSEVKGYGGAPDLPILAAGCELRNAKNGLKARKFPQKSLFFDENRGHSPDILGLFEKSSRSF
jgi:hypothetical protein